MNSRIIIVQIRPNGVQPHASFSPLTYRDVCAHVRARTHTSQMRNKRKCKHSRALIQGSILKATVTIKCNRRVILSLGTNHY